MEQILREMVKCAAKMLKRSEEEIAGILVDKNGMVDLCQLLGMNDVQKQTLVKLVEIELDIIITFESLTQIKTRDNFLAALSSAAEETWVQAKNTRPEKLRKRLSVVN